MLKQPKFSIETITDFRPDLNNFDPCAAKLKRCLTQFAVLCDVKSTGIRFNLAKEQVLRDPTVTAENDLRNRAAHIGYAAVLVQTACYKIAYDNMLTLYPTPDAALIALNTLYEQVQYDTHSRLGELHGIYPADLVSTIHDATTLDYLNQCTTDMLYAIHYWNMSGRKNFTHLENAELYAVLVREYCGTLQSV